jgi:intergrase/recombinase
MENKYYPHDEDGFRQYLLAQGKRNLKGILIYARNYGRVLDTEDASELLTISSSKRRHAMEALAALSKYRGCYNQWKQLTERYQLKWSDKDSFDAFVSIMDEKNSYSAMIGWLKEVYQKIPTGYANILMYATLVGLRPNEACQSISLIQTDLDKYLNRDNNNMILEHWKYPSIFIRNSKKAFISIVNDDIISIARNTNGCGYDALRSYLRRRKVGMHMGYCRKIFGTYLRMQGIESETIDMLQGRIPKSVFVRHYFRPDFSSLSERINEVLASLYHNIIIS